MEEIKIVACNYAVPVKASSKGTLCFVLRANNGNANESVVILCRSRGGRWIERWERIDRLTNFRFKTVVSADPVFERVKDSDYLEPAPFAFAAIRERIARLTGLRPSWPGCGFEPKGVPYERKL
jgi:hypothetical protein